MVPTARLCISPIFDRDFIKRSNARQTLQMQFSALLPIPNQHPKNIIETSSSEPDQHPITLALEIQYVRCSRLE